MRSILAAKCVRRDNWPDTERWARRFAASPARTVQDRRHRTIVADLLAQVEVSR